MDNGKILAIIPARGGSKGIPMKNVMLLAGKTLMVYSIEHALNTPAIDRVVVSTDNHSIGKIAHDNGAEVIMRPDDISGDFASTESAMLHVLDKLFMDEGYDPDFVVLLQPTSPIRGKHHISKAIRKLISDGSDSLFSASRIEGFVWGDTSLGIKSVEYCPNARPTRQEKEILYYEENGSIYITRTKLLNKEKSRLCGKISMYIMPRPCAFQVDSFEDLPEVEMVLKEISSGDKSGVLR